MSPIQSALDFLAHFDRHFDEEGPVAEVISSFGDDEASTNKETFKDKLNRHTEAVAAFVLQMKQNPEKSFGLTANEIEEVDAAIQKFTLDKRVKYGEYVKPMLEAAHKALVEAREILDQRDGKNRASTLARGFNYLYTAVLDKGASIVGFIDVNRSNALHAYAAFERLLGSRRYLNKEMGDLLYKTMLNNPDICNAALAFAVSAESLMRLQFQRIKSQPICYLDPDSSECEDFGNKFGDLFVLIVPFTVDNPQLKGMLLDFRDCTMPWNSQILTDALRVNLLDLEIDLTDLKESNEKEFTDKCLERAHEGKMPRYVLQRYIVPALSQKRKIREYLEECEKNGEDPDPVRLRTLNMMEGYGERLTFNLLEKVDWEDRVYNSIGGFVSAIRMIGFMTESGYKREGRVKLDFSPLGAELVESLTLDQSIKMIEFIHLMHEQINLLHPWFNAVHANPSKVFLDSQTLPLLEDAVRQSMADDPTRQNSKIKETGEVVENLIQDLKAMDWLTEKQKGQFTSVAANFIYNLHREFTLGLLTVGHASKN